MEKRVRVLVTFAVLIFLIIGLYLFTNWFSIITGYFTGESKQESIVNCLNEQGAEFYYSVYCSGCEEQAKELGAAYGKLHTYDCGKEMQNCQNIRGVPAWFIPNSPAKLHYGFLTLDELTQFGACSS